MLLLNFKRLLFPYELCIFQSKNLFLHVHLGKKSNRHALGSAESVVLEQLMWHATIKSDKCVYMPTSCCQQSQSHKAMEVVIEN